MPRSVGRVTYPTLSDLPLARATVARAAHLRADADVLAAALGDPRTLSLIHI